MFMDFKVFGVMKLMGVGQMGATGSDHSTHEHTDHVPAPGLGQEEMSTLVSQMPPQHRAERVLNAVVRTATKLRKLTSID